MSLMSTLSRMISRMISLSHHTSRAKACLIYLVMNGIYSVLKYFPLVWFYLVLPRLYRWLYQVCRDSVWWTTHSIVLLDHPILHIPPGWIVTTGSRNQIVKNTSFVVPYYQVVAWPTWWLVCVLSHTLCQKSRSIVNCYIIISSTTVAGSLLWNPGSSFERDSQPIESFTRIKHETTSLRHWHHQTTTHKSRPDHNGHDITKVYGISSSMGIFLCWINTAIDPSPFGGHGDMQLYAIYMLLVHNHDAQSRNQCIACIISIMHTKWNNIGNS